MENNQPKRDYIAEMEAHLSALMERQREIEEMKAMVDGWPFSELCVDLLNDLDQGTIEDAPVDKLIETYLFGEHGVQLEIDAAEKILALLKKNKRNDEGRYSHKTWSA